MSKAYFMIGVQGSGKTTFAKKFAEEQGLIYISADEIRYDRWEDGFDLADEGNVWREARLRMEQAIKEGKDFIVDSTMASKSGRKTNINFIRAIDANAEINGIQIMTDIETADERNNLREKPVPRDSIEKFNKRLAEYPPSEEDGFTRVIHLDGEFNPVSEQDRELLNQVSGELRSEFTPKIS